MDSTCAARDGCGVVAPTRPDDHRLAMAFAIAALGAEAAIDHQRCRFGRDFLPEFFATLESLWRPSLVKTDKIYLVGFMAAGKTTLAQALARRLGWRAEDVDLLIETRERRTVADIFARDGEPYFRSIERQVIYSLLPQRHTVIATGGSTYMDPENRAAIERRRRVGVD